MGEIQQGDTMQITVNGQTMVVTAEQLRESYQTGQALSAREAKLNELQSKAQSYDQLDRQLRSDPDGFVLQAQQMASSVSGRDYTLVQPAPAAPVGGDPQDPSAAQPIQDPRYEQLLQKLERIENHNRQRDAQLEQSRIRTDLESAVASHPILGKSDGMKNLAMMIGASALAENPNAPIDDVLAVTTAKVQEAYTADATSTVATRQDLQTAMPAVPQTGAPQQPEEVKPTAADLKSGKMRDMIVQAGRKAGLEKLFQNEE